LILGLARLGVVTASIGTRQLPKNLRFDAILSDRDHSHTDIKMIPADFTWTTGDGKPAAIEREPQGTDLCRIHLTSGTTGEAKGVALTHDMVLGRILRYCATHGSKLPVSSRIFCDMTWGTTLGYQFLIYALCRGGTYFVRGNNPENTLRAFDFYKVDTLVAAPAGLAEFLADFDKYRCQHTFDVVVTAGSVLSKSLSDRVRARFGPNLICDYGSAETSCAAAADARALEHIPGAVGYVTPGMMIQIVDDKDRELPIGREGLVRIRGDYIADGYFGDPEASAEFFRGGWFYPGDIGSLSRDKMLIISGRKKTILNVAGEKIKPETIEEVLTSFEGILRAAALTVVNQLGVEEVWAAIQSRQMIEENKLRAHCEQKLAGIFVPKRFIVMDALPTNEAGKLDRSRLAEIVTSN